MTKLEVKRGDTLELTIGPVVDETDTPQDLTGSTIVFMAKDRFEDDDASAVVTGSTSDGKITLATQSGSTLGIAYALIPVAGYATFPTDRTLHWDIQISQPGGRKKTLADGLLYVRRDVTRA